MNEQAILTSKSDDEFVLAVDLDGTLVKSDLLIESAFTFIAQRPTRIADLLAALIRGKAELKSAIASSADIDAANLPYDKRVLELIHQARTNGQKVYLASASNERYVKAVADHLGVFDGYFGSSRTRNLSSKAKALLLVDAFGRGGFDYVGNETADLAVWACARKRVAVDPTAAVERNLLRLDASALILPKDSGQLRDWVRLLRLHQWAKNMLVFVPLITAHAFNAASLGNAMVAFLAFSIAASSLYLVNDLVDLDADRKHLTKKQRPLACGRISVATAAVVAPVLLISALLISSLLGPDFLATIVVYMTLSATYTFVLKQKMIVDVVALASLYTIRVVGGALAIGVPLSEWLLAFSMFLFLALALVKRYTELAGRLDANLPDLTNRNYRNSDLYVVAALSAASGFNAITVFILYISSLDVQKLYAYPEALWLICPILIYWISRVIMLAHRRQLNDDPVVFALTDKNSLRALVATGVVLIVSAFGL